jgi:hypothetical protein
MAKSLGLDSVGLDKLQRYQIALCTLPAKNKNQYSHTALSIHLPVSICTSKCVFIFAANQYI